MKKAILAIAIAFVFAALLPTILEDGVRNSFLDYLLFVVNFISQNYFIFILGFIFLTIIFVRSIHVNKNASSLEKYLYSAFQIMNVFIVGIFLAYIFLLIIALVELNILATAINFNKNALGIVSDKNQIIKNLKENNYPPQIIISDQGQNRELVAIARTISGTNNFYGKSILLSIPNFLTIPIGEFDSSILLVDDTLVVTQLEARDLEAVSPVVSHLLIQQYFRDRVIKSYPKISIMGEKKYQEFRKSNFELGQVKVEQEIAKFEQLKNATSQSLEEDKDRLSAYSNTVEQSTAARDSEYKKCLSDGKYTLAYCKNLLKQWENITSINKQVNDLSKKVSSDESKLQEYEENYTYYATLGKSLKLIGGNVSHELGVFLPKDTIKIAFSTDSDHAASDYFETLVHEYLHYASYSPEKQKLSDVFFEEGLTEYFARQIIKDDWNISANIGYPISVKIIDQMTERILESELEEIYFTKDQNRLEEKLDQVYGENFYKNSRLQFLTLQYTSSPQQALQVANEIMKKMGGEPFEEKDLF